MLTKVNRLTRTKEFDNTFKKGRSSYDKNLGVKFVINGLHYNKFGIIINNKVSKKAVIRNKIRRQIRQVIKQQENNLKLGNDVIVVVLPESVKVSFKEIEVSVLNNFKKLKLLNSN